MEESLKELLKRVLACLPFAVATGYVVGRDPFPELPLLYYSLPCLVICVVLIYPGVARVCREEMRAMLAPETGPGAWPCELDRVEELVAAAREDSGGGGPVAPAVALADPPEAAESRAPELVTAGGPVGLARDAAPRRSKG